MFYLYLICCIFVGPSNVYAGEFTNFGKMLFQKADTWVDANDICYSDQNYYHINKEYIEKVRCSGSDDSNCEVWKLIPLVQPSKTAKFFCAAKTEGGCTSTPANSLTNIPYLRYDVYRNRKSFAANERPVRSGWYLVPSCN